MARRSIDPTRREVVWGLLGGVAAALTAACGGASETGSGPGSAGAGAGGNPGTGGSTATGGGAGNGGGAGSTGACTVYPEETAGPFYLDNSLARRDITEGSAGTPLRIEITVQNASTCAPLPDLPVDVWHCDSSGVYSGYPGQLGNLDTTGRTFLRGTQTTDAQGKVTFDSIYPGWYPGRTTHIHFKVHTSATTEATSQMYFDEAVTAAIYKAAPYNVHGPKDTANAADGVVAGNLPPLAEVTKAGLGLVARLTVNIAP